MEPLSWLGIGLALLGIIRVIAAFTTQGHKLIEPEPYIPSALEDWDEEFKRLTGIEVEQPRRRSGATVRGSWSTLLHPRLHKVFSEIEPAEEVFNEELDETVSIHPVRSSGIDAEY